MKKIGIIGLGNIGFGIAKAIADHTISGAQVTAVFDKGECPNAEELRKSISNPLAVYTDFDAFMKEDTDLVLEAANPAVVRQYARPILEAGKDFMMMSVGGMIEPGFLAELTEICEKTGAAVYIPCGAMTGLNIAAAGKVAGLEEAVIQTTKSIAGLKDAPYVKQKGMDIESLTEPTVIYHGNVYDAVINFPQNVNVAAAIALSGTGPENTMVEIQCDPGASSIQQKVTLKGAFGEMETRLKLKPSPNKRSSYLAVLSGITALQKYASPVKMGY